MVGDINIINACDGLEALTYLRNNNPDLILLDEPTSNLDSLNEGAILKSIYEERKDKTIVFVSHRESTLAHCDRVIHMESERVS